MIEWTYIHKQITSSTNDDAIEYSAHAQGESFVITANQQYNGRGRRGRSWIGQEGNLFASLGIVCPLTKCGDLAFITALALTYSILNLSSQEDIKIKWPNDVLVRGAKISGILIEKGHNDYLIVGVGVNISSFPQLQGVNYSATSLHNIGITTTCEDFLDVFIKQISFWFQQYTMLEFAFIRQEWLKYAIGIGTEIKIMQEQNEKRGIFYGIDDTGLLLLKKDDKIEKISAGDVFILNEKEKIYK